MASRLLAGFLLAGLPFRSHATDFSFNQDHPTAQPLVSSFFGTTGQNATFEYVIVGGGTAGLTLAARLASANLSVAVVEAGGFYETDNSNKTVVPGYATWFTGTSPTDFQPLVDWGISSAPQQGVAGRRLHYARGKTLGGSSARNYYLYQRSTIDAQQKWAHEVGDESWTFENLLPYYQRSVHFTPPNATAYFNSSNPADLSAFNATGGPLEVSFSNQVDPFGTWCRLALPQAGMPQIDGLSSGRLIGSSYAALTIDPVSGFRSSSESSFLQWSLNRRRAPMIYKNSLATEIMWNGTAAVGVKVTTAGTYGTPSVHYNLTATKEVILSAGAIQSPQLLMVSGIGNRSELSKWNITCKVDLPGVGKNMWDHPDFGIAHAVHVNTASASANNATVAQQLVQQYLSAATGPLSVFGPGYYGFEKLPEPYRSQLSQKTRDELDSTFPADWPELEWLPNSAYNGYSENKITADPKDGKNYATVVVALVAPLSRGTVTLKSADMCDLPVVDPAWLTADADRELVLQAFKRTRAIWSILADLGVAEREEAFPGSNVQTDEEIMDFIEKALNTVYHASATCKMGKKSDKMAVVDSDAFVMGTQRLRVVDASAFPFLPPGHPQSMVYAFAEKVADSIITGQRSQ